MCDTYSACSAIARLTLPSIILLFGTFLFEIVIVSCSLSENGTFGCPEAVLGDTEQATKKRDIWASRSCAWGQRDRLPKNGTFGLPEAVLGDNGTGYQKAGLSRSKRDIWSH
ncbi:hypothetical protein AVEN_269177-1 [Araneus ventricosus]|uniref:Uncharacterized protein n=1 Tax=Araneus ventricosus TaxID=182803 RepID=A0A4Y2A938_ARAVE|nr:hypothetical protein AVEN_269177-1 [Araneus ventricosus]